MKLIFKLRNRKIKATFTLARSESFTLMGMFHLEVDISEEITRKKTGRGIYIEYRGIVRNRVSGVENQFNDRGFFYVDKASIKRMKDNRKLICEKQD